MLYKISRKQKHLSSWGSGTGMAGIFVVSYSLVCSIADVPYLCSFIGVMPIVIVYVIPFFLVIKKSPDEPVSHH
jgi:hypothetical protein